MGELLSEQYKETLPVYKEWYAISSPKKKAAFETAHQGELIRFHMAERVLKKNYPDMRIPVKTLKKKSEELASVIKGISPELERVKEEAKQAYKVFVRECVKRNKSRILIEIVITS